MTNAPISTLGVYVAKFFPLICMAIVDAILPRILSLASIIYHGLSVFTWSAALGYHVSFQMSLHTNKEKSSYFHINQSKYFFPKIRYNLKLPFLISKTNKKKFTGPSISDSSNIHRWSRGIYAALSWHRI